MRKSSRVLAMASAGCIALLTFGTAGVANAAESLATPIAGAETSDQQDRIQQIEKMSDEELKELGQEQARQQNEGGEEVAPMISLPSHTFSHDTTVRLWDAAKTGGVGAVSGICAAVTPTGPIGRALAAGGCGAIAYFLADIPSIDDNHCLNVDIGLNMKLENC